MILRIAYLVASLAIIIRCIRADPAPDITTLEEGYAYIVKLACRGCPFLYQDSSAGKDVPWESRNDENALLLNVSLPYDRPILEINHAPIWPVSKVLPRIHATQVLSDFSVTDLAKLIEYGQLEAGHETSSGGAIFGLSYHSSIHHAAGHEAMVIYFDVFEVWSGLPDRPLTVQLDGKDGEQKMVKIVVLKRPVLSALESRESGWEIVTVELVSREGEKFQQEMKFLEWDSFGQIGTPTHAASSFFSAFLEWLDSGVMALFVFIFALVGIFVVLCLFCIFGCDLCGDEYEKAQHGKKRKKSWPNNDLEHGKGKFRSAEELGLLGRGLGGQVVGVGKSD
ncbi:hypothetical protein EJ04DRAFT_425246 [Polyplosphaeria fusca]|uniref:Uncharacterized protein n=1 Tax=Polyplosphaeria fusca TaxID=682080 RepID=A0A9P4RB14_9PLEO|nr:hypothetical protein EJ04DRAFT_425246 [Polyplosphaeria fusca]